MPSIQSLVFSAGLTVCCLTCPAFSIASDELFRNYESLLPPLQPWSGRSESLVLPEGHPWVTPSELSGLTATPDYDETIAWLKRLVEAAPELDMIEIGRSHQGRAIWMVVASVDRAFTAQKLSASGKPLLLAQAGIHSGEIDGKDAGLMLLRDMT
ncbi:MAG: M14 family zinc carboxypeptidase, partial [Xanthomonadales bacterium]|nr:M14 family zinc carboxypeptidase [Xanthomonadales bacterium]